MPVWAINAAFVLGFLTGLTMVLWTLVRPPLSDTGTGRLKFGSWEFELNGRAVFQLFVGALLITFPVLLSATIHPLSTTPTPRSYQQVDTIPDPSYAAFRFIRDTSILDLRGTVRNSLAARLPIGKKSNPVTLTNVMTIRKVNPSDVISMTYGTSGTLDIRCLTHPYSLRRAIQNDEHAGGELKETWEVTANVSDVAVGSEFQLIIEATYWNAFDTPQKQWYGTYPNNQEESETVSTLLLFPQDKPFSSYSLWAYPHGSTQGEPFSGSSKITPSLDQLSLYWEIPNAQGNRTFEVHWQ